MFPLTGPAIPLTVGYPSSEFSFSFCPLSSPLLKIGTIPQPIQQHLQMKQMIERCVISILVTVNTNLHMTFSSIFMWILKSIGKMGHPYGTPKQRSLNRGSIPRAVPSGIGHEETITTTEKQSPQSLNLIAITEGYHGQLYHKPQKDPGGLGIHGMKKVHHSHSKGNRGIGSVNTHGKVLNCEILILVIAYLKYQKLHSGLQESTQVVHKE